MPTLQVIILIAVVLGFVWVSVAQIDEWEQYQLSGKGQIVILPPPVPPPCLDEKTREHARRIMLAAIDNSLKEHTSNMFEGWVRDPTGQPGRAIAGMRRVMEAYIRSREAATEWMPQICEGEK